MWSGGWCWRRGPEPPSSRLIQESRTIRGEIVREAHVVATTLGMLSVTPELNERDYDHVLIDEAAAARLPARDRLRGQSRHQRRHPAR